MKNYEVLISECESIQNVFWESSIFKFKWIQPVPSHLRWTCGREILLVLFTFSYFSLFTVLPFSGRLACVLFVCWLQTMLFVVWLPPLQCFEMVFSSRSSRIFSWLFSVVISSLQVLWQHLHIPDCWEPTVLGTILQAEQGGEESCLG